MRAAREQLASEVRRLIRLTASAELPDEVLLDAAGAAGRIADALDDAATAGRLSRGPGISSAAADLLPQEFFPTSPVFGRSNPVAPPVVTRLEGETVVGTAVFDEQYEGPPGCVHGGVIALVLDELLGAANIVTGHYGMTGTLTIRYRKPTPLRRPLTLRARCLGRTGKKIRAEGAIYDGELLTAEAEGLFVAFDPAAMAAAAAAEPRLAC